MKNKLLAGVTMAILMLPINGHARYSSTYFDSPCFNWDYFEGEVMYDACKECLFGSYNGFVPLGGKPRSFDSNGKKCSVNEQYPYIRYNTYDECYDDYADEMHCDECMNGRYREISRKFEGDDQYSGIAYWYNSQDGTYECQIDRLDYISCAPGWYGQPNDYPDSGQAYLEGCKKCPGDATSDKSWGREKYITDCYIPKNTPFKDSTGTYQYIENCYYEE